MPTTRKKTVEKKTAGKAAGTAKSRATAAAKKASPSVPATRTAPRQATAARKASPSKATPARSAAKKTTPRKQPVPVFAPRAVPIHPIDGKPEDPRLAAALAARERWHGRSGRPALKSPTQAVAFARERLLVHPRDRSPLPNLLDPIIGRVCTEEERSEGMIAETLASWKREIYASPELLEARLAFERPTLLSSDLWPALVAVATPREDAARDGDLLTEEALEVLELLDRRGVTASERVRQLVGLDEETFASVHAELESRLLILSRGDKDEDDNPITVLEPLGMWADRTGQRRPDLEVSRAWTFLFIAALRSAVVLWPEEIDAIFPWSRAEREAAIAEAMTTGALITYNEAGTTAWVASPVPR